MSDCKHKINAYFHVGGRMACWNKFSAFLERQTFDHKNIKIIMINTVPHIKTYKEWLEKCDYEYAYVETPLKHKDRHNRLKEMNANQDAILDQHVNAEYLWLLDDDTIPPDDVVSHLLPHFNTDKVMAVSACYRLAPRIGKSSFYCAWPHNHTPPYYQKGEGIQIIGGCGWGCCLLKMENCRLFCPLKALPNVNGDVSLFYRIAKKGGIVKMNWDVECAHLTDDGVDLYPIKQITFV
jgi:hypothetical protein